MDRAQQEVIELFEYASQRLTNRMAGLSDEEWAWQPIPGNAEVTIRWRLDHILETLTDNRNRDWLGVQSSGQPVPGPGPGPAVSSAEAVAALAHAANEFARVTRELGDAAAEEIGDAAGPYGDSTRRSFVLHIADELIHHAAEAALLRELYAAR